MIVEFLAGIVVSALAIITFLNLNFKESLDKWILVTSKFIYYSGHPVLDDDRIYEEITGRFKKVFYSLIQVIFKTIVFMVAILVFIGISSLLVSILGGKNISDIKSNEFISFFFPHFLLETPFIVGTIFPVLIIPFLKKKKETTKKETYSSFDKFLHYVFLGNKNISRFLFGIERKVNKKNINTIEHTKNVYISGLARAGTTVLMQYLGQLSEFRSLSYKNLPFLFMPRTGLKIISDKNNKESERFHKDGIRHSLNSYEALEEPFWRNYLGERYIKDKTILKHTLDRKVYNKYIDFRKLIAGDKIYLAKNNNHLLRAESLHKFDRENNYTTITIIPFRDPAGQAGSLLKQHLLLSGLQEQDEFTLDYMDFLVHHEFGLHFKQPILDIDKDPIISGDKNKLDFWLEIWYNYYSDAIDQFSDKEGVYFFDYNSFVNNPEDSLKKLLKTLGIQEDRITTITVKDFQIKSNGDKEKIAEKYNILYKKLKSKGINNG